MKSPDRYAIVWCYAGLWMVIASFFMHAVAVFSAPVPLNFGEVF